MDSDGSSDDGDLRCNESTVVHEVVRHIAMRHVTLGTVREEMMPEALYLMTSLPVWRQLIGLYIEMIEAVNLIRALSDVD
jgi:hypothetical protein